MAIGLVLWPGASVVDWEGVQPCDPADRAALAAAGAVFGAWRAEVGALAQLRLTQEAGRDALRLAAAEGRPWTTGAYFRGLVRSEAFFAAVGAGWAAPAGAGAGGGATTPTPAPTAPSPAPTEAAGGAAPTATGAPAADAPADAAGATATAAPPADAGARRALAAPAGPPTDAEAGFSQTAPGCAGLGVVEEVGLIARLVDGALAGLSAVAGSACGACGGRASPECVGYDGEADWRAAREAALAARQAALDASAAGAGADAVAALDAEAAALEATAGAREGRRGLGPWVCSGGAARLAACGMDGDGAGDVAFTTVTGAERQRCALGASLGHAGWDGRWRAATTAAEAREASGPAAGEGGVAPDAEGGRAAVDAAYAATGEL